MQGECSFEENVIIQHSWYKQIFVYRDNPSKLNKNNDCSWFEKGNWIISAPPKKP